MSSQLNNLHEDLQRLSLNKGPSVYIECLAREAKNSSALKHIAAAALGMVLVTGLHIGFSSVVSTSLSQGIQSLGAYARDQLTRYHGDTQQSDIRQEAVQQISEIANAKGSDALESLSNDVTFSQLIRTHAQQENQQLSSNRLPSDADFSEEEYRVISHFESVGYQDAEQRFSQLKNAGIDFSLTDAEQEKYENSPFVDSVLMTNSVLEKISSQLNPQLLADHPEITGFVSPRDVDHDSSEELSLRM